MRRTAVCLFAFILVVIAAVGCSRSQKKVAVTDSAASVADLYPAPVQDSTFETDSYPTYGSPVAVENTYEPGPATTDVETRYHQVVKNDTLYGLARTYYGDQRRWKDIYEANRPGVSDPNRIHIGQRLLIP
jgi:nucleoid-associated protein YgaU